VELSPSLLIPSQIEADPNVAKKSSVKAFYNAHRSTALLGPVNRTRLSRPGLKRSVVYRYDYKNKDDWVYFDKRSGLINYHNTWKEKHGNNTVFRTIDLYAGPNGVSERPDDSLGRFYNLIVHETSHDRWTIYDRKHRRFFAINFDQRESKKGEELPKENFRKGTYYEPMQIGNIRKNGFLHILWQPPEIEVSKEQSEQNNTGYHSRQNDKYYVSAVGMYHHFAGKSLLVLDKSGRIDLLDKKTLTFVGTAGHLPAAQTFFHSKQNVTPKDLLAYQVMPLTLKDDTYCGMYVVSVNREGTASTLAVFGPDGRLLTTEHSKFLSYKVDRYHGDNVSTSRAFYFTAPWSPFHTVLKYLLENLQSPVLGIASHIWSDGFEATSGHHAMFILPNSFVSMFGREIGDNETTRFVVALLIIAPSLLLSVLLGWRVNVDANKVGLSKKAKLLWLIGTIAFGLSAYITYRLTKPKIVMVTCQNCGNLRRPDMENCHRCNSAWKVPELDTPAWRVKD
jgi:hypothetical protein